MQRDFEKKPYTSDEARVAKYIVELTGIGGGDDPIGFLIASHQVLSEANRKGMTVRQLLSESEGEEEALEP